MNKSLILLAVLLASAAVLYNMNSESASPETVQYLAYLSKYGKPVPSSEQLLYRSKLFAEYIVQMEKHNSDPSQKWQMGINQFSDLTKEEFMSLYLGEFNH
jgi:hypothetical protein